MNGVLNIHNAFSEEFDFLGECVVCAVGEGQIKIQRKVGSEWVTLTNDRGEPMWFVADDDGVIFNGVIPGLKSKRIPHRIAAVTTGHITFSIIKDR